MGEEQEMPKELALEMNLPEGAALEDVVRVLSKHPISHCSMPLAIVTAHHDGKDNAMTAGWVSWVNGEPPTLMVSIAPQRFTHDMVKQSGEFGVCFLGKNLIPLAKKFSAKSGRSGVDKFEMYCKESPFQTFNGQDTKVRLLKGAMAAFECKVTNTIPLEDHTLFLGRALRAYAAPVDPKKNAAQSSGVHMY